jgi:hypothetical protein
VSLVGQYEYGMALLAWEAGEAEERPRLRDYEIDSNEAAEIEGLTEASIANAAEGFKPTGPEPSNPNVAPRRAKFIKGEVNRLIYKAADRRKQKS